MAELTPIVTLTTISSTRANEWQARLVQRYSSVANRTTEHPTPAEGDLSYLEDSNSVWVYDGAAWQLLGPNLEVDGSVEVATVALTGSLANVASVALTIPATWASWKCYANATFVIGKSFAGSGGYSAALVIDGTAQQTQVGVNVQPETATVAAGAISGRRTGMTTTGSRTISLQLSESGGDMTGIDIFLYARAVRTS